MSSYMSCYKRTNDDWCGSYKSDQGSLVRISLGKYSRWSVEDPDLWFVCASGNDDMAIQIDYTDENTALCAYQSLLRLDYVDYADMKKLEKVLNEKL